MTKRRNKTQQGYAGMTIPQGLSLERNEVADYTNVCKHLSKFKRIGDQIQMPLNRKQRRLAKKLNIEITEVE
ncbi:hypothetical protein XBP1_1230002 [Xenorhabdus bovienii str. puntauvense]|uniref:Uncharacterized protein n=1 Tax=Xenorhabdus bovienii str. puntauvense TaxID=1398201 RepID=A0A077MZY0_XENBV|nr:hypothetical protein [Xenorhabdus bovienii]CDG95361.1 hypothetical protein XBP1_1230002 [Xenorhabdus bovienii str. puntauvense]